MQHAPSFSASRPGRFHTPKRTRLRLFVIVSAVVVFACAIVGCSPAPGNSPSLPTSKVTQPAAQTSPTLFPTSPGAAILGANIGTFIAKYGQPNSQPSNGVYEFSIYGNPHTNDVTIATQNNRVMGIEEDSPDGQEWSESEAIKSCLAFAPLDNLYKRQETFSDTQGTTTDLQHVYYSRSLAKQFPASDFTDENGDATTPGVFGIVLTYSTSGESEFLGCATQIGLNLNMIPGII
ncbi:MAG TPA: hypothetical protein VJ761_20570 [Ktedonobacteraceae bacterium]|nr:hypothetical protein [Ktedonobacteraceae bacterium]